MTAVFVRHIVRCNAALNPPYALVGPTDLGAFELWPLPLTPGAG